VVWAVPLSNTLTITEYALVQFSAASESVNQAAGTFSIPVTLSNPSSSIVSVPFTLGGTSASGTDYSGISTSPLTFPTGTTTEYITGHTLSDPGANKTLTFTLGTLPAGFILGSPSVNTLTFLEYPLVQFSAGSEIINQTTSTFSIPVTLSHVTAVP